MQIAPMTGILERIAGQHVPAPKQFRPARPEHFFALRVAVHLNEAAAVDHYVELCGHYSEASVLAAYLIAMSKGSQPLAEGFHAALERIGRGSGDLPRRDVAAIRIERRAIAIAVFSGFHLKYPPLARQLSSDPNKALGSAAAFIDRVRDRCLFSTAVMEKLSPDCEAQRSHLARVTTEVLSARRVAIWQFEKAAVLASFGYPTLRFRNQVREVMSAMWPEVNGGFGAPLVRDALALGLYCQVERMLSVEQ